jgi:hypothetical protein
MGVCAPIKFTEITRERFAAIQGRVEAEAHIEIVGDTGTASADGVTLIWTYSEPAQTLTLQCTAKPFLVTEGYVANKLRDLVAQSC